LPNSADDISGAAVASLLAQNALALVSRDRRGLALWRAEIVLQSETILASQEAESRDLSLASRGTTAFAIHIALAEAVLGSQETFIASRTVLICWRVVMLVSADTVLDSHRVYLASLETVIALQRVLSVSIETYLQELARGALATLTYLCLRTRRGLFLPPERSCSNFSLSKWMTSISVIDPKVWSSHCDTWFSAVENAIPSGVAILFSIENLIVGKLTKRVGGAKLQVFLYRKKKKITSRSSRRFLGKCAGGSLISGGPLCSVDDAGDQSSNDTDWEFLLTWF